MPRPPAFLASVLTDQRIGMKETDDSLRRRSAARRRLFRLPEETTHARHDADEALDERESLMLTNGSPASHATTGVRTLDAAHTAGNVRRSGCRNVRRFLSRG